MSFVVSTTFPIALPSKMILVLLQTACQGMISRWGPGIDSMRTKSLIMEYGVAGVVVARPLQT